MPLPPSPTPTLCQTLLQTRMEIPLELPLVRIPATQVQLALLPRLLQAHSVEVYLLNQPRIHMEHQSVVPWETPTPAPVVPAPPPPTLIRAPALFPPTWAPYQHPAPVLLIPLLTLMELQLQHRQAHIPTHQ